MASAFVRQLVHVVVLVESLRMCAPQTSASVLKVVRLRLLSRCLGCRCPSQPRCANGAGEEPQAPSSDHSASRDRTRASPTIYILFATLWERYDEGGAALGTPLFHIPYTAALNRGVEHI